MSDLTPRLHIESGKPSEDLFSVYDLGLLDWYNAPESMLCRGKDVAIAYAMAWGKWWLEGPACAKARVLEHGYDCETRHHQTVYRFWARVQPGKRIERRETVVVDGQRFYRDIDDIVWLDPEIAPRSFEVFISRYVMPRVLVRVEDET
jgi:hypothetical protein